jgi:hypothetical protein
MSTDTMFQFPICDAETRGKYIEIYKRKGFTFMQCCVCYDIRSHEDLSDWDLIVCGSHFVHKGSCEKDYVSELSDDELTKWKRDVEFEVPRVHTILEKLEHFVSKCAKIPNCEKQQSLPGSNQHGYFTCLLDIDENDQ